jgi:hypothetical protein
VTDHALRNAVDEALRLLGITPDVYDVDAFIGTLEGRGIHIASADTIEALMFNDRCDFECSTCHPEDAS